MTWSPFATKAPPQLTRAQAVSHYVEVIKQDAYSISLRISTFRTLNASEQNFDRNADRLQKLRADLKQHGIAGERPIVESVRELLTQVRKLCDNCYKAAVAAKDKGDNAEALRLISVATEYAYVYGLGASEKSHMIELENQLHAKSIRRKDSSEVLMENAAKELRESLFDRNAPVTDRIKSGDILDSFGKEIVKESGITAPSKFVKAYEDYMVALEAATKEKGTAAITSIQNTLNEMQASYGILKSIGYTSIGRNGVDRIDENLFGEKTQKQRDFEAYMDSEDRKQRLKLQAKKVGTAVAMATPVAPVVVIAKAIQRRKESKEAEQKGTPPPLRKGELSAAGLVESLEDQGQNQ